MHSGEARAWLEAIGASVDELCFVTTLDGRVRWASASVERHTDRTSEHLRWERESPLLHPEDADRVIAARDAFVASGRERSEPVEHRLVDRWGVAHAYRSEMVRTTADGAPALLVVCRPVPDAAARRREDELRQAQKMEAIGRLAGGVAHDFNNMLGVIRTYVDLLTRQRQEDGALLADLAQIGLATERAARLTGQLLAFSRRQVLAPTLVDLGDVARSMATMLSQLIGPDIDLRVTTGPCGVVRADRGQLEQIVLNLVVNSRDAMPHGGVIDVEVTEVAQPEGPFARLSVRDKGSGMTEPDAARAAEPFFTTRAQGTGLGLSTVHGIVHQSGGHLAIDSAPGEGTRVDVFLPIAEGATTRAPAPSPAEVETTRPAVILLVEDERLVRESVHRLLVHLGYTVVAAESPGEALGHCRESEEKIDLLLTDFAMPGMNGLELGARICKLRPTCRMLLMSGYAAGGDTAASSGVKFLPKPFSISALADAVRSALEA